MELYLDSAATTFIDKEVKDLYFDLLNTYYGSTGSLHQLGQQTLALETAARAKIATLLKVKPGEIYFNSGATEGNNFAIKGSALQYQSRGRTIITTKVEHPSVSECFRQLEKDFHFHCIYLPVNESGVVNIEDLKKAMSDDVIFVSVMYVNHEVGAIMPIKEISNVLKQYPKVIFHSDVTQAIGKVPVDFSLLDIATMSAHKIHGIKGSGFLYKKDRVTLYPLISGHPARNALRAGTSNWPSNVAMAKALENTLKRMPSQISALKETQQKIIAQLKLIPGIEINTNPESCIPGIVNFSALGYNPEVIIRALSERKIYVSSRSVCSVGKVDQVSSTLFAMKKNIEVCISSIRCSFDSPLSDEQISYFTRNVKEVIESMRK